jgi:type VI secretion system protein ImpE
VNATEHYKAGQLQEAIEEQLKAVKAAPADHGKRLFLFELLAFAGDLDRARKQIDVINYGELELDAAVMAYRKILDAEQAQRRLFSEGLAPKFFADQPEHVHARLEALNRLRENRPAEAQEMLTRAYELVPPLTGELNGKRFDSLRDADDVFSTVLEVFGQGGYYWVPFEQIDALAMKAPRFPRDLLWVPARLDLKEGSGGNVFLPALYHGTHAHADNQVKLGRANDWKVIDNGPVLGLGSRTFLVGDDTFSLLEWRELSFDDQTPPPVEQPTS